MPSDGYWRERNLKDKALSVNAAEDFIREHAGRMYAQAWEEIQEEIEAFYQKYADENGITLQEARRKISQAEFNDIDWEAYCRRSAELERELRAKKDSLPKEIVDRMAQEWQEHEEKIKTLAARGNITRLELLQTDIDRTVLDLHDASQVNLYTYLGGQYEDGYYREFMKYSAIQELGTALLQLIQQRLKRRCSARRTAGISHRPSIKM